MPRYFDFTVSLQDVLPRPWRRFLIGAGSRFAALHSAIQVACGWSNSHLYLFRAAGDHDHREIAGLWVEDGLGEDAGLPNAEKLSLSTYFGVEKFTTCLYLYDFGDGWTHDVQLNEIVELPEQFTRRLSGGEHAFPPDDCGGPLGYLTIQHALRTGEDPEGTLDWAHGVWGWTGTFDLGEARRRFDMASGGRRARGRH
jgi:pRiA4b ORF-3-like protein